MKTQIEQRLTELKKELASGQELLQQLETRKQDLRETVLRIGGAIQVLEELLKSENVPPHPVSEE
jgi:uncharacterized protein involved in exopolysaccharide biosynthesis